MEGSHICVIMIGVRFFGKRIIAVVVVSNGTLRTTLFLAAQATLAAFGADSPHWWWWCRRRFWIILRIGMNGIMLFVVLFVVATVVQLFFGVDHTSIAFIAMVGFELQQWRLGSRSNPCYHTRG